jgi:hypothetical protein
MDPASALPLICNPVLVVSAFCASGLLLMTPLTRLCAQVALADKLNEQLLELDAPNLTFKPLRGFDRSAAAPEIVTETAVWFKRVHCAASLHCGP